MGRKKERERDREKRRGPSSLSISSTRWFRFRQRWPIAPPCGNTFYGSEALFHPSFEPLTWCILASKAFDKSTFGSPVFREKREDKTSRS